MSNWVFDLLANIPSKSNIRTPRSSVTEWRAEDAAIIKQALEDLRSNQRLGKLKSGTHDGSTPAVDEIEIRSNGGRLQIREGKNQRWRRVVGGDDIHDVRDYGAVGDGVANDSSAFLDAIATFNGDAATGLSGNARVATLFVPKGTYLLDQELSIYSNPSYMVRMLGEGAGQGPSGSYLKWVGANDATMLHMRGTWDSLIRGIAFNLNAKADRGIWFQSLQATGGGGCSTSRVQWCKFGDCRNATSIFIAMGGDSGPQYQVDQMTISENWFTGALGRKGIAVKQLHGGNVKNLSVIGGTMTFLNYGVVSAGSGFTHWARTVMAEVDVPYVADGAPVAVGLNLQCEGCKKFAIGSVGTNAGLMMLMGCEAYMDGTNKVGAELDDDYMVEFQGGLTMFGNHWYNHSAVVAWQASHAYAAGQRRQNDSGKLYEVVSVTGDTLSAGAGGPTGTASRIVDNHVTWKYIGLVVNNGISDIGRVAKVKGGGTPGNAQVTSFGNYYQAAKGQAPIYDGSGNNSLGSDEVNSYAQVSDQHALSFGDVGGDPNGLDGPEILAPTFGTPLRSNSAMLCGPHPDATSRLGMLKYGMNELEFTYQDFQTAATNLEKLLGTVEECIIRFTGWEVVTPFAGTGGTPVATCTAKLSTTANGGEVIAATSIMAAGIKGKTAAELNTAAGKFWDLAGANIHPSGGRYYARLNGFFLRLDADVNLSNLTAGKIIVRIELLRIN